MKNIVVAHHKSKWCAVPANNGGNGPVWQWNDEFLIGYTCGEAKFTGSGHQVDDSQSLRSYLARSKDGGETWESWCPDHYQGNTGYLADDALTLSQCIDFKSPYFVMRIEGDGYHGNSGQQWFYSYDKGVSWNGPYTFGNLLEHPELTGKKFTSRTGYLVNSPSECLVFLSVRESKLPGHEGNISDKVFLAKTVDGGQSFDFVSWVVPPSDPFRAVMPSPLKISKDNLITAIRRRKLEDVCWVDCYRSLDNGENWEFLSKVGDTGRYNGNPPALVKMTDGRLCCVFGNRDGREIVARYSEDHGKTWGKTRVLRHDFHSRNEFPDLGYPRLFQRSDGKLVAVYFWCSPERPETHIAATIFEPN